VLKKGLHCSRNTTLCRKGSWQRLERGQQPGPYEDKKSPQVGENLPQVVPGGAEDCILGITEDALQPVPSQFAV